MNLDKMLNTTCSLISVVQSKTATGGIKDTETVASSGVPCAMKLLSGNEVVKYGGDNKERFVRFYFKGTQTVLNSQKILFNSEYYDILDVYDVAFKGELIHVDTRFNPSPITSGSYDS